MRGLSGLPILFDRCLQQLNNCRVCKDACSERFTTTRGVGFVRMRVLSGLPILFDGCLRELNNCRVCKDACSLRFTNTFR